MKMIALGVVACLVFVGLLAGSISLLVASLPGAPSSGDQSQAVGAERSQTGTPALPVPTGDGEIVAVQGIRVHRSIATNLSSLLVHAKRDGLALDGWGYRPKSRQIELRIKHCGGNTQYAIYEKPSGTCKPPTARPGRSQHEVGLAVDFKNCSNRSTVCYRWLARNAATYGFKNLPSEAWHWSTTGR